MRNTPSWTPSPERVASARITAFRRAAEERWDVRLPDYAALHRFSVEQLERFWTSVWDFTGVIGQTRGETVVEHADHMPGARFFPDSRLNFAENLLRRRDGSDAIVFWGEDRVRRRVSSRELYDQVSSVAQALRTWGVQPGDRVAGYLPNVPEAIIAMLAAASIGATWSSCSPDFGVQGVVDRFGQIEPSVLVAADGYFYNGKRHDRLDHLRGIRHAIPSIERLIVVPYTTDAPTLAGLGDSVGWPTVLATNAPGDIDFASLPFDHPLYILYSSGTTGTPKCIVHGAGGTLLQHLKEHQLHCDIRRDDRVFYFTTCGWMMWNWLASVLASEATIILFDGSPFHPGGHVLFDLADAERMTLFGTSARFIDALRKADLEPAVTHRLDSLRTMTSTGSPLVPEAFDYVYDHIKRDLHLASIAGGTDIVSCFVGGNPAGPVWRGEIQAAGLGMRVEVWDDQGRPLHARPDQHDEQHDKHDQPDENDEDDPKGELVCTAPFPSMPIGFWNDPEGARYRAAYFERYPGTWHHGDYIAHTPHDGYIIYGRSDAVLNPGGVRIGTAEIYRQVERLREVVESLVIGQDWDDDVRIVLFVRLREGLELDVKLIDRIKTSIRQNTTPRHVPAKVLQVTDIPRTKSGKIVELAVRDIVHGRPVKNREALANPEALALYADRPELGS